LGGPGSGWFASAGHVPHKKVDVYEQPRFDKSYANLPDAYNTLALKGTDHYTPEEEQEFESISAYTNASGDYGTINKIMRGLDPSSAKYDRPDQVWVYRTHNYAPKDEAIEQAKKDIANIRHAMEKTPLKGDVTVYRGIPERLANNLIGGKEITDNAFQSTSLSLRAASKFAWVNSQNNNSKFVNVLEFAAKKGEPAIFSDDYDEKEVLLKGGKYKAISYTIATTIKDFHGDIPTFHLPTRIITVERIATTGEQTIIQQGSPVGEVPGVITLVTKGSIPA
jgi:hypothetical protein